MSSFGSADFPVQHPVAEPTLDDELQLIFEVESLQTQLSEAGLPVDEKIAHIFIQSVAPKFSVPLKIFSGHHSPWRTRRSRSKNICPELISRLAIQKRP